jgi:alpha-tubulin suppressor-like RCC1 family protein
VWGLNSHGQCGIEPPTGGESESESEQTTRCAMQPHLMGALLRHTIVAVGCGAGHTVVISNQGQCFTWGLGGQGQLGQGTTASHATPVPLESSNVESSNAPQNSSRFFTGVACGIAHTVLLTDAREVFIYLLLKSSLLTVLLISY